MLPVLDWIKRGASVPVVLLLGFVVPVNGEESVVSKKTYVYKKIGKLEIHADVYLRQDQAN